MKTIINRVLAIKLKVKVLLGYIFMSGLIFAILALIGLNVLKTKAKYDALNDMSTDIQMITQFKSYVNGIRSAFLWGLLSNNPDILNNIEGVLAQNFEKSNETLVHLKKGRYKDKVAEIEKEWVPFIETMRNELMPLAKAGKINEALQVIKTVQTPRAQVFMEVANGLIDNSRKEFSESMEAINKEIKSTVTTVAFFIVISFSAAFVLSFWFINKYIVAVLHDISSSAEKIAGKDLTIKVEAKTADEFGELAVDVNKIILTMQTVMRDVANKTVHVLRDATSLTFHGKEVSLKVDSDLERTTAAAAATEEMSMTIGDIARSINIVSQAAESARTASSQGKEMIGETVSSIHSVNQQLDEASDKVRDLSASSKKIDGIVVMIKDIADQTNLLALNAAIEAARAGEQGRGFAVVADEVRKLAQRTANATYEINNILHSIHSGTVEATDIMVVAVEKAKATGESASRLDGAFRAISDSFRKVTDMVLQVVSASEEQSATATEISSNLTNIADDARESSRTVKAMATSFEKFSSDAKEFLQLLDGFKEPRMRIGVLKADYVLWLHRILEFLDAKHALVSFDELQAERSRMGQWLYGEGKDLYGRSDSFREVEAAHRRLHELGTKAYAAAQKGDRDVVKATILSAMESVDGIISLLAGLESEAAV